MKFSFSAFLVFFFINANAQNEEQSAPDALKEQVVPSYLLSSIKQIKFNNSTATCYFHNDSNYTFIVTVKHLFTSTVTHSKIKNSRKIFTQFDSLLCKENSLVTVDIYDENGWKQIKGKIHFFDQKNENIDVAIIQFEQKSNYNSLYLLSVENMILGQHCYFCGYPLGLKTPAGAEFGYSIPLLKFAVFSGTSKNSSTGESIIFLDGNNTYGLSGAPVLYYNFYLKKWRIGGMICGYYKQTSNIFNSQTGKMEEREENSGVIKAIDASQILNFINKLRE